ncbi:retrotransposon gag protein, partial [Rhizoctonia solani AG-3 Rhs1AP]
MPPLSRQDGYSQDLSTPAVIYFDDKTAPAQLSTPITPTKAVPTKQIQFGHTTIAGEDTQIPTPVETTTPKNPPPARPTRTAWGDRKLRDGQENSSDSSQQKKKLPAPPITPAMPTLRTPQARRTILVEDDSSETEVGSPVHASTPRIATPSKPTRRKVTMEDIPEEPTICQEPPHLASDNNPEATFAKGKTSLGWTRKSQMSYRPGIEPSSFTTVGPLPPSPVESMRSPDLGPAPKTLKTVASSVTIVDQGPSLYSTQVKPSILRKKIPPPASAPTEPEGYHVPQPSPPSKPVFKVPTPEPTIAAPAVPVIPATLVPSNKEEMIQIPFSHCRQSALPKHIKELAQTNTAMRELIVTQRRRKSLTDQVAQYNANGLPGDPYGDSSSSDDEGGKPPKGPPSLPPSQPDKSHQTNTSTANSRQAQAFRGPAPPHFDTKLKISDTVPTWDGNKDTLADWVTTVNELAEWSDYTYVQLGELVPLRLEGDAKEWWYSHDASWRLPKTRNWDTLKDAILTQFMNRTWMEKQTNKAQLRSYRDSLHPHETPSQYIRDKKKLLQRTHEYQSERQLIYAVLEKAPKGWGRIFDTSVVDTWDDLEQKVEYHEELLISGNSSSDKGTSRRLDKIESLLERAMRKSAKAHMAKPSKPSKFSPRKTAHTRLVGSRKEMPDFKGKPLDHIVSKGQTPEMKGARPCVYCKSGKHWDNDCPLNKKKKFRSKVRANLAAADEQDQIAQADYEALQETHEFESSSESEEESDEESSTSNESDTSSSSEEPSNSFF